MKTKTALFLFPQGIPFHTTPAPGKVEAFPDAVFLAVLGTEISPPLNSFPFASTLNF